MSKETPEQIRARILLESNLVQGPDGRVRPMNRDESIAHRRSQLNARHGGPTQAKSETPSNTAVKDFLAAAAKSKAGADAAAAAAHGAVADAGNKAAKARAVASGQDDGGAE